MHVPREQNPFADSLATLASMIPVGVKFRPLLIEQRDPPNYLMIAAVEPEDEDMVHGYPRVC